MPPALPSYPDLQGKVAVVTGGSRGIGAATCHLLAANGALVARLVDEGRIVVHADAEGGRWLVPTLSGLAVADGLAAAFDLSLPN